MSLDLKQVTSQQATYLVDDDWTAGKKPSSCRKEKTILKLIDQVAEITKQPEAESGLSKKMLGNFQTENSYDHK